MNATDYLKPEIISRLHSLELQARLLAEGYLAGVHKSPFHGFSVEFSEYRPYYTGESLRHLDWKKYAKSDRMVVRQYEDDTNLNAFLVMDSSASMGYESGGLVTKFQYCVYLASSLAYLLQRQRDAVGLALTDPDARLFVPRRARPHLHRIFSALQKTNPGGDKPVSDVLAKLSRVMKRKGMVIIFTDLLEKSARFIKSIKQIRYSGHEIILFHVLDPQESGFEFRDASLFEDMETGEKLLINPLKIQKEYIRHLSEHAGIIKKECRNMRIDYCPIITNKSFEKALTVFLQKRARIHS